MPYTARVGGTVGVNYRSAPLDDRTGGGPGSAYRSAGSNDPSTPLIEAFAGDRVTMHVLAPSSEQAQVFSLEGHEWAVEPERTGSSVVSSQLYGGLETLTLTVTAGGKEGLPGDYLYGDHREPYREAGLWGLFRVYARGEPSDLTPLAQTSGLKAWKILSLVLIGALAISAGAVFVARGPLSGAHRGR